MTRTKVLCLSDKPTRPAATGSRVRIDHLIGALEEDFSVDLAIVGWPGEAEVEETRRARDAHVTVIRPPAMRKRLNDVARWAAGVGTPSTWLGHSATLARASLAELIARVAPQAVWVSGPWSSAVLPHQLPCPLLVDVAHLEGVAGRRELAARARAARSVSSIRQLARFQIDRRNRVRGEAALWQRADLLTVTSAAEVDGLPQAVRHKVVNVPNGVELPPVARRVAGSRRLLLVGSFHYAPNADAARVLASAILPSVRATYPEATVDLVGATTTEIDQLGRVPGVFVHGFVRDIAAAYARSEIAVVPLRAGSGTKLKVLEAFAHGVPVVTTRIGIEGLDVQPGMHVSVGDSERTLADAVLRLLRDPSAGDAQAEAARSWVAERFSWESVGEAFRAAVRTVIRSEQC